MNSISRCIVTHKIILISLLFLSAATVAYAQTVAISGIVTDSQTKEPIIGGTVSIKGTSSGTITDIDGRYSIMAGKNATLVFSYIGFETKEITPGGKTVVDVALQPELVELDNVVVLGTRMKKSDLTGAVGNLSEKQLREVPSVDMATAMQGKVAGVYISNADMSPGSSPTVKVRGINSINFGKDPIYVIDGILVDEGIGMLNPNDIASIEVLKDASAKAIYGYRAANGVIVVTTKRGKQGEGRITYDGWVGITNYDKSRMKTLNAGELYDLRIDAFANHYMDNNPQISRQEYIDNVLLNVPATGSVFSPEELANGQANRTSDWLAPITRTGFQQNHSLSFAGASDKTNYYVGFSYSGQKGVLSNSDYTRYSGKINLEQNVKSWLKIGTNTTYSHAITHKLEGDAYSIALRGNPMQTIDDRKYMYWQGVPSMDQYNPVVSLDIDREQVHDRLLSTNFIEANPVKNLFIRTTLSVDYYNKQDYRYTPGYTGQSVRDSYNGIAWHWKGQNMMMQWDNSVSYEKIFNRKHRLFIMASAGLNKFTKNENEISAYGFPTDDLGYKNLEASYLKDNNTLKSNWETQTAVSFVGRINYSYENKYYLTVSAREDGSSKFADGKRWGFFPSFSAAWNLSEEAFMENVTPVDLLKLRVGYGVVGNQDIPAYAYLSIYKPNYTNGSASFVSDKRLGNPDVTWEKQKQFNAGFDLSLWNDRFSFAFDYFYTLNTDLLMEMSLSPTMGFENKVANVGELENQGLEITVGTQIVRTKDFNWNLSLNLSHDKNKVKKLYNGLTAIWKNNSITSREGNLFVGEPVNTFWAYKVDRIAQAGDMAALAGWTFQDGRIVRPGDILPVDKNGDNKITHQDDMFVVGKKDPKLYGGFSTDLSYRNFTLSAVFTYSWGLRKYSWMYDALMSGTGTSASHKDMLDRWTPQHTNTDIPRAFKGEKLQRFGVNMTDFVLLDASYLRCSALTLAYSFPARWINPACSNLRLYVSANNLFTVTKYKGFDPEGGEKYPASRMFTFGVNVSF